MTLRKAHRLDNLTFSKIRMTSKLMDELEASGKEIGRCLQEGS